MICSISFSCFFFFKQKTAYEMRISDWSSDVCSSDLFSGFPQEMPRRGLARARPDLRSAENGRLATLHLQFAIGAQSQIALCRTVARLRVISGSALLFGGAALEALQHNQAFQPLPSRAGVGVLPIPLTGFGTQGRGAVPLAATGRGPAS